MNYNQIACFDLKVMFDYTSGKQTESLLSLEIENNGLQDLGTLSDHFQLETLFIASMSK